MALSVCVSCGRPTGNTGQFCQSCVNALTARMAAAIHTSPISSVTIAKARPTCEVVELFDRRVFRIRLGNALLDISCEFVEMMSFAPPGKQDFLATVVVENGVISINLDNSDTSRINEIVEKFLEANKKAESEKP